LNLEGLVDRVERRDPREREKERDELEIT